MVGAILAALMAPTRVRAADLQGDPMYQALRTVLLGGPDGFDDALAAIVARGDLDMAPGLVLAMRFSGGSSLRIAKALRDLTGHDAPARWFDWMVWQERHPEILPHPAYTPLKRAVFLGIDPAFSVFLEPRFLGRDRAKIRFEEVTWGGVPKDGIPSLDHPALIPAARADYLRDQDLVFGVAINGDARAYPLRIMGWHEMFNEVIGGVPVALAYCTLCGSGILYETRVAGRDRPHVFGSSGFLYRSNKLMYDRRTHTLWNQFTGRPVIGPLADSGIELRQRPVVITRWDRWRRDNPTTQVLDIDTGFRRDYRPGVVYRDYFASPDLMFPTVTDDGRLAPKAHVFGIRVFNAAKAWPLEAFRDRPVINDAIGDRPLVLVGDAETRTVRAFERGGLTFMAEKDGHLSADGTAWTVTEDALTAPDGRTLPRVAGHVAYWFAWNGYLGVESELYGDE